MNYMPVVVMCINIRR